MRKRDDFPHPLGPSTSKWSPCLRLKDRASTKTSPLGDIMWLCENHHSVLARLCERLGTDGRTESEEGADQDDYSHINKLDILALHHLAPPPEDGLVALGPLAGDELLVEAAGLDVVHDVEKAGDAGRVAGRLHDVAVREHEAVGGVRGRQELSPRADEGLRPVPHAGQGLAGQLDEDGDAAEEQA